MPRKNVNRTNPAITSRAKEDRGLPDESALLELARTYLELQHQLWPEMNRGGFLPTATPTNIKKAAEDFREQFLSGDTPLASPRGLPSSVIAAAYLRYSCDNSNPRSLDQQLRNILERARRENAYIPLSYVFADAAVTGTIASRRGYELAKASFELNPGGPEFLFCDEMGRASRDTIENLKLGRHASFLGKHLIGVTDGFDSRNPQSKMLLAMFGMMNETFVDQLREKVNRGMSDAFRLGKTIYPPAFGYALLPITDEQGALKFNRKGQPERRRVICEENARYVQQIFELYGERNWSLLKIARHFNHSRIAGRNKWHVSTIRQILARSTYAGVEYYGMTKPRRDPDSGRMTVVKVPQEQWKQRAVPDLQIVSDELWQRVQERLATAGEAYPRRTKAAKSRTQVYPTTLFRPICVGCGVPMILGRSGTATTGGSFCCRNGIQGTNGCEKRSYKSIRIVETAVLGLLQERIFTEDFIRQILESANQFLQEVVASPSEDLAPRRKQLRGLEEKRDRLVNLLDAEGDEGLEAVVGKIRSFERQIKEIRAQIQEAEARCAAPPPPMQLSDVELILQDLRGLLSEDVAVAAPILTELTGPILVDQVQEEGRKKPTWIATLQVNGGAAMVRMAASQKNPTTSTWEYLSGCGWSFPASEFQVRLEPVPKPVAFAEKVREMHENGVSVNQMAYELGCAWETVDAALTYVKSGCIVSRTVPQRKKKKRPAGDPPAVPKYRQYAAEVARLINTEKLPRYRVAQQLGIDVSTVARAYDQFRRQHTTPIVLQPERKVSPCHYPVSAAG